MRFGFDLRPFLKLETGVGVYFRNLLFELALLDRKNEYCLFSASWKDRFPPGSSRRLPIAGSAISASRSGPSTSPGTGSAGRASIGFSAGRST
jgi:hypothetical protein